MVIPNERSIFAPIFNRIMKMRFWQRNIITVGIGNLWILLLCMALPSCLLLSCFLCSSCTGSSPHPGNTVRSVYYWSTTFRIDHAKACFIRTHHIRRIYLRYFDVVDAQTDAGSTMSSPMPNATVDFELSDASVDSCRAMHVDIIPVVFIVNSCFRSPQPQLAALVFRRIRQMSATNAVAPVREIQIDCDWTKSTQSAYFSFLSELRQLAHAQHIRLSTTIRLHQLSMPVPPIDRGALMVYNTGDITDLNCRKPILDLRDVKPYLRYLPQYKLPLATAYPVFRMQLLARRGRFLGLIRQKDEWPIDRAHDSVITRQPEWSDLRDTQQAIEENINNQYTGTSREVILYDLSPYMLNHFKPQDYEEIYCRRTTGRSLSAR